MSYDLPKEFEYHSFSILEKLKNIFKLNNTYNKETEPHICITTKEKYFIRKYSEKHSCYLYLCDKFRMYEWSLYPYNPILFTNYKDAVQILRLTKDNFIVTFADEV